MASPPYETNRAIRTAQVLPQRRRNTEGKDCRSGHVGGGGGGGPCTSTSRRESCHVQEARGAVAISHTKKGNPRLPPRTRKQSPKPTATAIRQKEFEHERVAIPTHSWQKDSVAMQLVHRLIHRQNTSADTLHQVPSFDAQILVDHSLRQKLRRCLNQHHPGFPQYGGLMSLSAENLRCGRRVTGLQIRLRNPTGQ